MNRCLALFFAALLTLLLPPRLAHACVCASPDVNACLFGGHCDACYTADNSTCNGTVDPCQGACETVGESYGTWACYGACPPGQLQVCYPVGRCCLPSTPAQACAAGYCGSVSDGCGGTVQCTCPAGQSCAGNTCCTVPDQATACAGKHCGSSAYSCGTSYDCGDCPAGLVCNAAQTACVSCSPKTCADFIASGVCGVQPDGCGSSINCEHSCPAGQACGYTTASEGTVPHCVTPVPAATWPWFAGLAVLLGWLGMALVWKGK